MGPVKSECGLLALPRELRDSIWEKTIDASPVDEYRRKRRAVAQPAITRVCGRIRTETLPVFYNVTSFDLDFRGKAVISTAKRWLLSLEQNARHIRRLCFYYKFATGGGHTYVLYLTLNPYARGIWPVVDVEHHMIGETEATDFCAHDDQRVEFVWDAQYELEAILDRQSIMSMGRKELLSMLFVVSEYFKGVEEIHAQYFDEDEDEDDAE
ncbi:hypothetical protein LTR27_010656 [Elasticomyces elasticus]|nr:hypothetical protein LTR27_010656 [Elasticomyces elasticus]